MRCPFVIKVCSKCKRILTAKERLNKINEWIEYAYNR